MSNTCHTLEVTVISAEDLTIGEKPIKKNAFAIVVAGDASSYDPRSYSTRMSDRNGGARPRWNERMFVDLPRSSRHIIIEVRWKGLFGVKVVGRARIPVSDFLGERSGPQGHLHALSYRLRDDFGVKNGIVNLSIRVTSATAQAASSSWAFCEFPAGGQKDSNGTVVAGIPIWFANPSAHEL